MATDRETVRTQAREWVLRMSSGEASAADHAALRDWLAASSEHARAFEEIYHLWGELDRVREAFPEDADTPVKTRAPAPTRRRGGFRALAACLLLAVLVTAAGLFSTGDPAGEHPLATPYSSQPGEIRSLTLADGSTLTLGAYSRVVARFTPERRQLELLRGEAFFEVAHDPRRPFRVSAGNLTASALGTAFSVSLEPETVRVAVTEGRVALDGDGATTILAAGDSSGNDHNGRLPVTRRPATDIAAWRTGRRDYYQAPLSRLVADLNRYSTTPVIVASRSLDATPVTASFDHFKAVDRVLEALEEALPVRIVRTASGIHIRAR